MNKKPVHDSRDRQDMAQRLRWVRHYVGLGQRELGEELGVGVQAVSNWEKGRSRIGIKPVYQLLIRFQISSDFIIAGITSGLDQNKLKDWLEFKKKDIIS